MKTTKKNQESEKGTPKRSSAIREETTHRHHINSKISDDDLRNVRTELEIRGETSPGFEENKEPEIGKEKKKIAP